MLNRMLLCYKREWVSCRHRMGTRSSNDLVRAVTSNENETTCLARGSKKIPAINILARDLGSTGTCHPTDLSLRPWLDFLSSHKLSCLTTLHLLISWIIPLRLPQLQRHLVCLLLLSLFLLTYIGTLFVLKMNLLGYMKYTWSGG